MCRKLISKPTTGASLQGVYKVGDGKLGRQIEQQMHMIGFAVKLEQFAFPCSHPISDQLFQLGQHISGQRFAPVLCNQNQMIVHRVNAVMLRFKDLFFHSNQLYNWRMDKRKYTFKLYPKTAQAEQLQHHLDLHRQLYNAALEERISAYQKNGICIRYNDQQASLTQIRSDLPEYKEIPIFAARMTLRRLDKAFSAFFRRVKAGQTPGFPRFKSKSRFSSFEMCSHGEGWQYVPDTDWHHGKLWLRGIGHIKARGKARVSGIVKTSQVMFRQGAWWLSITIECEPKREEIPTQACGVDWGVDKLLTISHEDGTYTVIDNQRWFKSSKETQIALQQSLSRKKRGSSNWKKAKRKLSLFQSKIARKRHDHHHKLSADLAQNYALIAGEKLQISNMTRTAKGTAENPGKNVAQKAGLNREILDTAPAALLAMINYKVSETGGWYCETPTRQLKPSQRCPDCWTVAKKTLSQRHHDCGCGCSMPRDAASALVNLRWALGCGQELADAVNPTKPLLSVA